MEFVAGLLGQQTFSETEIVFDDLKPTPANQAAFDEFFGSRVVVRVRASDAAATDFDKTGVVVWPASVRLARLLLEEWTYVIKSARVLEVGCGAGVAGLVAAKAATYVLSTDGEPEVVEMASQLTEKPPNLEFRRLVWGEDSPGLFDVVLGADVCHWPAAVPGLVKTVSESLTNEVRHCCRHDTGSMHHHRHRQRRKPSKIRAGQLRGGRSSRRESEQELLGRG